jgi:hypothetical protein
MAGRLASPRRPSHPESHVRFAPNRSSTRFSARSFRRHRPSYRFPAARCRRATGSGSPTNSVTRSAGRVWGLRWRRSSSGANRSPRRPGVSPWTVRPQTATTRPSGRGRGGAHRRRFSSSMTLSLRGRPCWGARVGWPSLPGRSDPGVRGRPNHQPRGRVSSDVRPRAGDHCPAAVGSNPARTVSSDGPRGGPARDGRSRFRRRPAHL